MNRFRKLKIHSKFRPRRWDTTTVPEIRLEGKWLAELGFEEGSCVRVEQEENRLVITVEKG